MRAEHGDQRLARRPGAAEQAVDLGATGQGPVGIVFRQEHEGRAAMALEVGGVEPVEARVGVLEELAVGAVVGEVGGAGGEAQAAVGVRVRRRCSYLGCVRSSSSSTRHRSSGS